MSLFIASDERFIRITLIFYDPLFGMTVLVVSTSIHRFSLNTERPVGKVVQGGCGDAVTSGHGDGSLPPAGAALGDPEISLRDGSLQPPRPCAPDGEAILNLSKGPIPPLFGRTIIFVFLGFTLFNRNRSIIITHGPPPLLLKELPLRGSFQFVSQPKAGGAGGGAADCLVSCRDTTEH